jgi:dimethylamine/trimethylamine dehydrogenase
VNVGSILDWSLDSGSSRFFQEGYQLEWTGRIREATAKPVVGVGRLTSPDRMAEIVASGVWDVIGAARPSIADPFLPRKVEEGRYGEVRECIGANICIAKGDAKMHLGCVQNATAGEEFRRGWHPERFERAANADRDVLVLGAGPAGMECAIVLGKRGFRRVHLVEAERDLGGCLRWIPRLPGLGEWARVVNWRRIQLDRLANVELVTGGRLSAGEARRYGAELVVVATGSRWAGDGLQSPTHEPIAGADASLAHVLTPEQVMVEGKRPPGERVLVYDADGYHFGAGLAELLAGEGHRVELATPYDVVAPECDDTLEGPLLRRRLHDAGVRVARNLTVTAVEADVVVAQGEFGEPLELEADAVVLVTQRVSDDALYHELRADAAALEAEGVEAVYRIGDCLTPRHVADAIWDGHRLGREIDSDDPSVPVPHRRELPAPDRAAEAILRGQPA